MHDDRWIGSPDPLRMRVFGGVDPDTKERLTGDERVKDLIEFVAQLDDRVKELEGVVTELVTRDVPLTRGEKGDL